MPASEFIIGSLLALNTIVTVGLAVLILVRAYRQPYARFFIGVLLCAAGWTIGDILALYSASPDAQNIGRFAFYIVPMGVPPCLWFFSQLFPEGGKLRRKVFVAGALFSLACAALAWRYIDSVGRMHVSRPMNELIPVQPGFLLYGLYLSIFFTLTYITLYKKLKRATGVARVQIAYTFYGVLIGSCLALVSNVSLPVAGIPQYIWLGPIFTLGGVSLIALAVIRYHLFDIRFFVVRATAYLATLLLVAIIYVAPFVIIANSVIGIPLSRAQNVIVISLAVVMLYSFLYLKNFFDKATGAVFLRNFYTSSDVLDKLGDILVHTGDLEQLKQKTAAVLEGALQPQFIRYVLLDDQEKKGGALARLLTSYGNVAHLEIIETDTLSPGVSSKLPLLLRESEVAIAVALRTTHEDLGYIVLGHKRSGEMYSERDKQLLGVAADEVAISLQNMLRYEEIKQFSMTLQDEVDNATRKLRRQNKRLEELDNIKDDFISMASHQLRTPLTSVKGYISMVLEGDAGKLNSTQTQMLKQAFASSQRMVFLITDLLNVSRLKTGKFIIDAAPMRLDEVVAQELEQLRETAQVKHIELTYDKPKTFPELMLDEVKIRQVLMNFVDNAIYYTPDGGHIKVELIEKPSVVEFRVTDDGIGVPKSEQHHLFTKFYRATNARKARPDGTGLGLFMAQKVIVAQGGSIIFSSQENKGSTFGFSFSKSRLAIAHGTQPPAKAAAAKR